MQHSLRISLKVGSTANVTLIVITVFGISLVYALNNVVVLFAHHSFPLHRHVQQVSHFSKNFLLSFLFLYLFLGEIGEQLQFEVYFFLFLP